MAICVAALVLGLGTSAGLFLFNRRGTVWWMAPIFVVFWGLVIVGLMLLAYGRLPA